MATPAHLRRINQRRIIGTLLRLGSATRADLAKATAMSQPTAGKIVDELLAADILQALDTTPSDSSPLPPLPRMGRPGQLLCLNRQRPRFLSIQLGVVHTRMALLPVAVPDRDEWAVQIPTARNPHDWLKQIATASQELVNAPIDAVVLSVPGVVDERSGQVLLCPNLRWAETVNLAQLLQPLWNVPVSMVQEIRALALGHLAVEPASGDFLLVDFGDGVGGAAVLRHALFESSIPLSGELGHTPVLGNKRRCGCGTIGCVETLVSRQGFLESFAAEKKGPHSWPALVEHISTDGVEPWLAASLDAAAVTIAGALNVLGVRRAVITGSLTELPPAAIQYLSDAVIKGAMWARFGEVVCQGAPRRRNAGLVSAAIDRVLLPELEENSAAMSGARTSLVD
ncbi:MAG TPA: ROK family protein [Tepidisphaeraceae bacterium]|nr:ROK family protein [Tepidisphaeraceae bacterium]